MTPDLFDLSDRIVVVTGGLGQLGRAYAKGLAERGARVAVLDRTASQESPPVDLLSLMRDDRVMAVKVDVTRRSDIESALARITDRWGVPHALINNAALDSPPDAPLDENGPFESYPEASWDRVMEVNVKGVFLCCQILGRAMANAGRGSVVNISSIYGVVSPDQALYEYRRQRGETFYKPVAYSASKSALLNLTRYLAVYWARRGVRVNTLTLAGVYNGQERAFLDAYTGRIPIGRMAEPLDYVGPVVFLVSDASRYVTGSNLTADGGWTAI